MMDYPVTSLVIVVLSVLVLSCRQTDKQTHKDIDEHFTSA